MQNKNIRTFYIILNKSRTVPIINTNARTPR